jgi:hypothetical protein
MRTTKVVRKENKMNSPETEYVMLRKPVFYNSKCLAFNDLANKEQLELETARNCYVCKTSLLHHF